MSAITRHLSVHGRVQGVGFRAFVKYHADKLKLDGFVRNRTDDAVEVLVRGDANTIGKLITLCHEGPPAARVERVDVTESKETVAAGFKQLPTM